MTVCYNKLWKLLIDKNMKKKDLRLATGMSTTALAKLGRNEHINTEILTKICPTRRNSSRSFGTSSTTLLRFPHRADSLWLITQIENQPDGRRR